MTAVYAALAGPLTLFGKAHAVGTTCTAPEPNYSTLCEKTQCAWNCKTPTLCPKPKCQLTCEQPGCTEENTFGGASGGSAHCQRDGEQNKRCDTFHDSGHSPRSRRCVCHTTK